MRSKVRGFYGIKDIWKLLVLFWKCGFTMLKKNPFNSKLSRVRICCFPESPDHDLTVLFDYQQFETITTDYILNTLISTFLTSVYFIRKVSDPKIIFSFTFFDARSTLWGRKCRRLTRPDASIRRQSASSAPTGCETWVVKTRIWNKRSQDLPTRKRLRGCYEGINRARCQSKSKFDHVLIHQGLAFLASTFFFVVQSGFREDITLK